MKSTIKNTGPLFEHVWNIYRISLRKVKWIPIFRHELIIRLRLIFTCASAWCLAPLLILDIVRLSDLQLSSWGRAGLAAVWISSLFGRIYTRSINSWFIQTLLSDNFCPPLLRGPCQQYQISRGQCHIVSRSQALSSEIVHTNYSTELISLLRMSKFNTWESHATSRNIFHQIY